LGSSKAANKVGEAPAILYVSETNAINFLSK
jgi:hypothetical protein